MTQSITVAIEPPEKKLHATVQLPLHNYGAGNNVLFEAAGQNGLSKNGLAAATAGSLVSAQSTSNLLFIGLLLVWYSLSVGHNILNKRLLDADLFPFPFTLTLLQLAAITLYSYVYIRWSSGRHASYGLLESSQDINRHVVVPISDVLAKKRNRTLIVALSLGKFMSLVFSHLSLYQVPLAFTHTGQSNVRSVLAGRLRDLLSFAVKGGLPLFVVFFSRLFLKTKHSTAIYLSLIPVVVGISMASLNSSSGKLDEGDRSD